MMIDKKREAINLRIPVDVSKADIDARIVKVLTAKYGRMGVSASKYMLNAILDQIERDEKEMEGIK